MANTTPYAPTPVASEMVLIAALNFHPEWLTEVRLILPDPDMFYARTYPALYKAMLELSDAGRPIDLVLAASAAEVPLEDAVDVLAKLPSDLWLIASTSREIVLAHAKLVQDAWIKREAVAAAHRKDGVAELHEKLSRLTIQGLDRQYQSEDLAMLLIEDARDEGSRLPYPFADWQMASGGGVRQDELIVVAARPGIGKSAVLSQWAWQLARANKRVLFVSAEMSAKSLTRRIASQIAGRNLVNATTAADLDAIDEAADQISRSGLMIHELTDTTQLEGV